LAQRVGISHGTERTFVDLFRRQDKAAVGTGALVLALLALITALAAVVAAERAISKAMTDAEHLDRATRARPRRSAAVVREIDTTAGGIDVALHVAKPVIRRRKEPRSCTAS
jgi:hypothetical protein